MRNIRIHLFLFLLVAGFLLSGANATNSYAASNEQAARISIEELQAMMSGGEEPLFIDTRNSGHWTKATNKIPGALRLTNNRELADFAGKYPTNTAIVTYCT